MIDSTDAESAQLIRDLRRVVQRISLISHAPTQSYDVVMKGDDVPSTPARWRLSDRREPVPHLGAHSGKSGDTKTPRGGIDRRDDFQMDYRQKSHVYFEHKLNRIVNNPRATTVDLDALLKEAEQAVEDWIKTPAYKGAEPLERGTFRWRCTIADHGGSPPDIHEINRLYRLGGDPISRSTIYRYRERYRGLRKVS